MKTTQGSPPADVRNLTEGKGMGQKTGRVAFFLALWVLAAFALAVAAEHQHGGSEHQHGKAPMETLGERLFSGKAGPWDAEARLIDMKAQMEKSGVSAKAVAKLTAKHHLMVILTDPKTKKPVADVAGQVEIAGPDKASSSKVPLVVMGGHIGSDVSLPNPGKYRFRVTAEGGGRKGEASFDYDRKP
jgi:hypothetical protein